MCKGLLQLHMHTQCLQDAPRVSSGSLTGSAATIKLPTPIVSSLPPPEKLVLWWGELAVQKDALGPAQGASLLPTNIAPVEFQDPARSQLTAFLQVAKPLKEPMPPGAKVPRGERAKEDTVARANASRLLQVSEYEQ